jgi:hypothetical protein
MTQTFPCPTCGRLLQVRYGVRTAGQLCPCPICGTRYLVQTMSESPTPGELAYTAWFHAAGLSQIVDWARLGAQGRACWDAAAQAVLAQCVPQEEQR